MASFMLNERLNKFFADEVQLSRDVSSGVVAKVLPEVREVLSKVNACEPRYRKNPDTVGSYYQGLKVEKADEFDFSIPFDIGTKLQWGGTKQMYFGFNDTSQNDEATMNESLCIVPSRSPLENPGPGYVSVELNNDMHNLLDVQFSNFLIPFFVKLKFRQLLFQALNNNNNAKRKDVDLRLSRMIHGPALTMTMDVDIGGGKEKPLSVSIDFAVVVHASLPFADFIGWPRPGCRWPAKDKIAAIREKGINVVAKKNFHWFLSFADLEKCLVRDVDRDGGCRKKVHRIMKTIYHKSSAREKSLLSSYMLKNAWLWECEDNPGAESWCQMRLGERFLGCIERLRRFIEQGKLPQYFHPKIDLLRGKDIGKLRRIVDEIYCNE